MTPTWRPGNRLGLLENGEGFFPRVWQVLEAARESVLIETFILGDDEVGRRLVGMLCALARRGVRVAVLADGFGSDGLPPTDVAALDEAGVRLVMFEPRRRFLGVRTNVFRRMHRKIVVVDDRLAFLGGINFCADHLRSAGENSLQDYAVEIEGPVVADIAAFVRDAWASGDPARRRRRRWWLPAPRRAAPPDAADAPVAAFVVRDNDGHRDDIERAYRLAIRAASEEVLIASAYFFPGYRFLRDLRAAARRGVRVILVVQGKPDLRIVTVGLRWLYHFLVPAGIRVREFAERPLHAKVAVVDGRWSTVGSSNLDPLSLSLNLEANLLVDDPAFAASLRGAVLDLVARAGHWVEPRDVPPVLWWQRPLAAFVFHFLRHFPAWAGWLPAHRSRLQEVSTPNAAAVASTGSPSAGTFPRAVAGSVARGRPGRWLGLALAVVVVALLARHVSAIDWRSVWEVVTQTRAPTLALICAVALAGHALYGMLDLVSARIVRHGLPRWRSWLTGVVCYGLGLNVGALVGAVASKLAVYRRQGLRVDVATRVLGLGILGNWLGWALLLALVLSDPGRLRHLPRGEWLPDWLPAASWAVAALALLFLLACARGLALRLRGRRFALPPPGPAALQIAIGIANWAAMAAVLHLCLGGVTTYGESLAVLLLAAVAAALAHVPGGWGVLEFVVVVALAGKAPAERLLASVLLFRFAYYLVPLMVALPGLVRLRSGPAGKVCPERGRAGTEDAGILPSTDQEIAMPRGDKSSYTDKQKRQAEHIEEGYKKKGLSDDTAERRAWATVNKQDGGGKKSGSGRKGSGSKDS